MHLHSEVSVDMDTLAVTATGGKDISAQVGGVLAGRIVSYCFDPKGFRPDADWITIEEERLTTRRSSPTSSFSALIADPAFQLMSADVRKVAYKGDRATGTFAEETFRRLENHSSWELHKEFGTGEAGGAILYL